MIRDILVALKYNFETDSEYIAIAKGKYKLPTSLKEGFKEIKKQWLKKN